MHSDTEGINRNTNNQYNGDAINYESLLSMVGDQNRYQWKIFAIMCLQITLSSISVTGQSYLFITPPLLCDGQVRHINYYSKSCNDIPDYCNKNFTITVDKSSNDRSDVVTSFDLYCSRNFLATITQSIYFLGSILGGSIMSYFADRYGRRITYLICFIIYSLSQFGLFLSFDIYFYIVMNFFAGFGALELYILNFVILNESSSKTFRQRASVGTLVAWSAAEILATVLFYYIHDWRIIIGCFVAIPSFFICIFSTQLIETPQYYLTKKNFDKFYQQLDLIAIVNKKDKISPMLSSLIEKFDLNLKNSQSESPMIEIKQESKKYSLLDLFKYSSLRKASIGFIFISFTLHLIYYGGLKIYIINCCSQYSISDISEGNMLYILGITMAIAEFTGYIIIRQFIPILPRKKSIIASYILQLGSIACFLFFGFSTDSTKTDCDFCAKQIIVILIACTVRIFNSIGFALQGLYANEVYPTVVRTLGTGFLYSVGIIGSFMSPYIIKFSEVEQINPYLIIGAISITGPIGTLLIRETLNKPLMDEIEELKKEEVDQNADQKILTS